MSIKGQRGISLIELILFIVIVSVAVLGVMQVLSLTTSHSVDPLRRKQAIMIAEGLLEEVELAKFTYCDPSDANAATATGAVLSATGCSTTLENVGVDAGETRPYDNVNDYVSAFGVEQSAFNSGGVLSDAKLTPLGVTGYSATLKIVATDTLGTIVSGAAPAAMQVLRITVTVRYDSEAVVLDGYRTRYAPNQL